MTAAARPGVCRYCQCTEDSPCSTPPCGEPCNWLDAERTVCSGRDCVIRYSADRKSETSRKMPAFRIDETAGRVRRCGRKKRKGGKAA